MIFLIILVFFSTAIFIILIDRWLIEYFLKKTASKNHPFIPNKFLVPPNLKKCLRESFQNVKNLDWFNVILARYWLEISRSYGYKERIKRQISKKLGSLRKYVNEIIVEDLDVPQESFLLKEMRILTRDQVDRLQNYLKENGLFKSKTSAEEENSQTPSKFELKLNQILGEPILEDDLSQIFCLARISHAAFFTFKIRAHVCEIQTNSLFPFKFNNTSIDKRSDLVFKSKISFGNYSGRVLVRLPGNNTKTKWEVSFIEDPNFEIQAEAYLLKNSDEEEVLEELNIISINDRLAFDFIHKENQPKVLGDIETSDTQMNLSLEDKKIGKSFFSGFMRRLAEKAIKKRILFPHFHKLPLPGITSSLKTVNHRIDRFDIANHREWMNNVKNNLMIYTSMNYRIKESNENVLLRKNSHFINGDHDRIGCVEIDFRRSDQKEMRHKMLKVSKKMPNLQNSKDKTENNSQGDHIASRVKKRSKRQLSSKDCASQNFIRDEQLSILLGENTSDSQSIKEGTQSDVSSMKSKYQSFAEPNDSICLDDSKEGSIMGKDILLKNPHLEKKLDFYKGSDDSNDSGLESSIQPESSSHESNDELCLSPQTHPLVEKAVSKKLSKDVLSSTETTTFLKSQINENVPSEDEVKQVLGNCENVSTSSDQELIKGIPIFMKEIPSDDHNTRSVLSYFYNLSLFNTIFSDFSHMREIKNLDRSVSIIKMHFHDKSNQTEKIQDYIRIVSENSIIFQRNCIKEPEFLIFKFIDGKLEIYHYFLRLRFNIKNANKMRKKILQGKVEENPRKELFCTNVKKFLNVLNSVQSQIKPPRSNDNQRQTSPEIKKQYEKEGLLMRHKRIITLSVTQKNLKGFLNDPYLRLRLLRENIKILDTQRITEKITSFRIKDIKTPSQNNIDQNGKKRFHRRPIEILSYSDLNQFIDYDVSNGRVCVFSIRLRKSEKKKDLDTSSQKSDKNNESLENNTSKLNSFGNINVENHLTLLSNYQSSPNIRRLFLTPLMILKQFVTIGEKTEPYFLYNKSIKYIIKKPAGLLHLKLESEISDQFYISIKINNKIILGEVKVVLGHVRISISLEKSDNTISLLIQPKTPRDKRLYLQIQFHNQNVRPIYLKDNLDEEQMVFVSKDFSKSHTKDEQLQSVSSKLNAPVTFSVFDQRISDKEGSSKTRDDSGSLTDSEYIYFNPSDQIQKNFKFLFECTTLLANQKSFEVKFVTQHRTDNIFWDISPDNNLMVFLKDGRSKNLVSFHGNRRRYPDDKLKINVKNISSKRLIRYRIGTISNIIN